MPGEFDRRVPWIFVGSPLGCLYFMRTLVGSGIGFRNTGDCGRRNPRSQRGDPSTGSGQALEHPVRFIARISRGATEKPQVSFAHLGHLYHSLRAFLGVTRILVPGVSGSGYTGFVRFLMRTAMLYFAAGVSVPCEREGQMRPRKHLRSLPTRTRPSLFGSD